MSTTLPNLQRNKNFVEMKAVTWQKDSHGLFDYETKALKVKKLKVDNSCRIYRNQDEIIISENKRPIIDEQHKHLTQILQVGDNYFINPIREFDDNDNYLIVRSLKNAEGVQKGYVLQPGDILKLGRIEYSVIEFRDEKNQIHSIKDVFNAEAKNAFQVEETNEPKQCRICWESENVDDPFITPCKCKGYSAHVHFECLKKWIDCRGYKKESGNTIIYKWKKLECEVCQETLPQKINFRDKTLDLAQLERPQQPYIILENLSQDKKAQRGIYLIKASPDDQIKLGRGHQCEIRISDISVSRLHAYIKFEKGNFIIVDNNSKFGTLVKLQNQYQICNDKIAIQIGRTVLTFVMKSLQGMAVPQPGKPESKIHKQTSYGFKK
ncbi:hypothetical protein pb186bvf_019151 [Paramecium bursaria]